MMSVVDKSELKRMIAAARSGSESNFKELIVLYEPLIMSLLSKFSSAAISKNDIEDLHQELLIIFCNAVMKYNLDQDDVDFGLYAKICMERGMVSQLRAAKKRANIEQMPDESLYSSDIEESDLGAYIIESEAVREMWKLINENLSEYENTVWNLHLAGLSSVEIAKEAKRDVKSIDNALCRIRKKLRKALKRDTN
jgi:RNA polymerase sporulation-specific sigma factor